MTSKSLRICTVALALMASSPVLAQETTTDPAIAPAVEVEQDDGFDLGWLGLLGLLGLAGLKGRQRDDTKTRL